MKDEELKTLMFGMDNRPAEDHDQRSTCCGGPHCVVLGGFAALKFFSFALANSTLLTPY